MKKMKIKTIIKLSLLMAIALVFIIATVSFSIAFKIRENSLLHNKISQLIFLQERMNQTVHDITESNSITEVNDLKILFDSYETDFQSIRKNISTRMNKGGTELIENNKSAQHKVNDDLSILFLNAHKVAQSFAKTYALQEKKIKHLNAFEQLSPQEEMQRADIYKQILAMQSLQSTRQFGSVQYYSQVALYQHQSSLILSKWIAAIVETQNSLSQKKLLNDLDKYKLTATNIGTTAIHIKQTTDAINQLRMSISGLLKSNKLFAIQISESIEKINLDTTYQLFFILFVLTIFIILFIIFFSIKVSANVGFSVDQIEEKVQQGIKQIVALNEEIESTQREIVFTMGSIAEHRSKETGNHVKRVAQYSYILARHFGLSEQQAELLKQASPMHDIGKIAIPDAVLNKPGRFDEHERKIMDKHAFLGYEMLSNSERPLLKTAAIVAHEHHEKWDGSGYPRGLSGDDIHIYGRITALADVFDALGSDRVYKKAWDNEKIFKLFREEKGKHFDPKLIDIFFDHLDEFLEIQTSFKDVYNHS